VAEFLVDSSAWVRFNHAGIADERAAELVEALEQDRVRASTILVLEQGFSARDADAYARDIAPLRDLPFVAVDAEASARACDLQEQLVRVGHHRLPPADLLVAAMAEAEGLVVLHYDKDFDVILEHTDCAAAAEWLAPRGSL
jgi:predicted nucleic acid-binding protein